MRNDDRNGSWKKITNHLGPIRGGKRDVSATGLPRGRPRVEGALKRPETFGRTSGTEKSWARKATGSDLAIAAISYELRPHVNAVEVSLRLRFITSRLRCIPANRVVFAITACLVRTVALASVNFPVPSSWKRVVRVVGRFVAHGEWEVFRTRTRFRKKNVENRPVRSSRGQAWGRCVGKRIGKIRTGSAERVQSCGSGFYPQSVRSATRRPAGLTLLLYARTWRKTIRPSGTWDTNIVDSPVNSLRRGRDSNR